MNMVYPHQHWHCGAGDIRSSISLQEESPECCFDAHLLVFRPFFWQSCLNQTPPTQVAILPSLIWRSSGVDIILHGFLVVPSGSSSHHWNEEAQEEVGLNGFHPCLLGFLLKSVSRFIHYTQCFIILTFVEPQILQRKGQSMLVL